MKTRLGDTFDLCHPVAPTPRSKAPCRRETSFSPQAARAFLPLRDQPHGEKPHPLPHGRSPRVRAAGAGGGRGALCGAAESARVVLQQRSTLGTPAAAPAGPVGLRRWFWGETTTHGSLPGGMDSRSLRRCSDTIAPAQAERLGVV